jgi:FAD/FMN-containing dehydrogenase
MLVFQMEASMPLSRQMTPGPTILPLSNFVFLEHLSVAFPQDKDEVALALRCARNASVKVSVLGRGHSFQGYSFGSPGNLVIDMEAFTELSFDTTTNQLTYGGGSNVGPTAKFLWDTQKRHFPHVRGSHVGLVGSSFGGGYGSE